MLRLVEQNHLLTWPDEANSHLGTRHHSSTSSIECEIKGISHHVFASHKQTCIDLEKASQFITEALQNAVQRNMALRMLIQRFEDRASENGRYLSEQMEANRQMKLQVEELQKHLEDKDNSLTQANQTIAILNNELGDLQQQLLNHQSSDRTIQEVTEWLEDGKNKANIMKEEDAPVQTIVVGIKEEQEDPAEAYAATDNEYQTSQPDDTFQEQIPYSSGDIKIGLVQEGNDESGVAPVIGSRDAHHPSPPPPAPPPPLVSCAPHQPSSPPQPLPRSRGLSVEVIDCRTTQGHQGTRSKHNQDGEQSKTGRGRGGRAQRGRGGGVARGRGMQLFSTEILKTTASPVMMLNAGRGGGGMQLSLFEIPKSTADPQAMVDIVEQHLCSVCGERFSTRRDLKVHRQMHKEKPKIFTKSGSLNKRRGVNAAERPYPCNECGKRFSTLQILNQHLIVHTGERNFPCQQCGMRFSQAGSLKRHQLIHMGVKPYHCAQCGKRFARAAGLERHQRIHTGERPFHCAQCGRAFTFIESMTRHQRLHTRDKAKYN
ncbi:zinc finger protein 773-like isoform X2 [Engraulis encrasicolus]|uniref:zinc finger protein 773-like isoform X2 n=1 Tax=Engraulis encrasicolus TaxID=184585 RepID=UPI002FCF417E